MPLTHRQKAQTAVELAVFGAILIFVLGVIVRTSLTKSHLQQNQLRATRQALTISYMDSNDFTSGDPEPNASRNTASVLIVEDRLTAASAKYGAVDRMPIMIQGSGSHTANALMPICNDGVCYDEDLPRMDVFVNGKHFVFTTAAFKIVTFEPGCPDGSCFWDDRCAFGAGCARLYKIVDNHPVNVLNDEWCDGGTNPCNKPVCDTDPGPDCTLSVAERFDLDRNNRDGAPGDVSVINQAERERFAWQWDLVMAFREDDGGGNSGVGSGIDMETGKGRNVDVDGDLKLESIESLEGLAGSVITSVQVRDFQDGDYNAGYGETDPGFPPGFTDDIRTYTFVKDAGPDGGTYLQIDEGQLFAGDGDDRQYVRSVSKKDTIDLIERLFRLSNITDNVCIGNASQQPAIDICDMAGGECHISANIDQTCVDIPNKIIYMRSVLEDRRGRKWITDTEDDPYVNFSVPN